MKIKGIAIINEKRIVLPRCMWVWDDDDKDKKLFRVVGYVKNRERKYVVKVNKGVYFFYKNAALVEDY
jgi:hypothetical protein